VDKGIERLVGKNLKDIHPSLIITQGCRKVKNFFFFGGGGGGVVVKGGQKMTLLVGIG
jgi:hypothetical protein